MAEGNGSQGGSQKRTLAVVVGFAVWVLVGLCCIGVLVLPTVKVARDSLMHLRLIGPKAAGFAVLILCTNPDTRVGTGLSHEKLFKPAGFAPFWTRVLVSGLTWIVVWPVETTVSPACW